MIDDIMNTGFKLHEEKSKLMLNEQVQEVIYPSLSKIENSFNQRFLKITEAMESRTLSKVQAVLKKFEEEHETFREQIRQEKVGIKQDMKHLENRREKQKRFPM